MRIVLPKLVIQKLDVGSSLQKSILYLILIIQMSMLLSQRIYAHSHNLEL